MIMTATATPTVRLLAGYHEMGRAAGLRDHLARYGPVPPPGEHLIHAVGQAGLTGRDGTDLPVARTLRAVASSGRTAEVVVDAADREPAGGKDRLLLTLAPHLVLDGAALAARVVDADEIVVHVHPGDEPAAAVAERDHARLAGAPIRFTDPDGEQTVKIGGDGTPRARTSSVDARGWSSPRRPVPTSPSSPATGRSGSARAALRRRPEPRSSRCPARSYGRAWSRPRPARASARSCAWPTDRPSRCRPS